MNPFGDSSDEDDDFNPFAKKKAAPARARSPSPSPPPRDSTDVFTKKSAVASGSNSNPFDSDSDEDEPPKQKPQSNGFMKKITNPFGAAEDTAAPTPKPAAASVNTNPFADSLPTVKNVSEPKPKANGFQQNFDSSTNPFGSTTQDVFSTSATNAASTAPKATAPKPRTAKHVRSKTEGASNGSNNPFDFEANFDAAPDDKNQKQRKGFFSGFGKGAQVQEAPAPLAQKVDQDVEQAPAIKRSSVAFDSGTKTSGNKANKPSKPGGLSNASRSKSEGYALSNNQGKNTTGATDNQTGIGGWLRSSGKNALDNSRSPGRRKNKNADTPKKLPTGVKKGKDKKTKNKNVFVQCWPYDDYHKDQQKYYESIQDRDVIGTPSRRKGGANNFGYNSGSDDDSTVQFVGKMSPMKTTRDRSNIFDRPDDLPTITEAVQNLSLFEFESKAEERAISIISTWLFDAGLIDELLVNGGSGYGSGLGASTNFSVSGFSTAIASVKSSEGVEVGAHGFPLEGGLKIDKEAEKMRANTQRELTLINTRLNDGVAASGAEVQELVTSVATTKSELGRLRELATYISSGYKKEGGIPSSDEDGLLLADYPRLKRAINARRNIFRCFRELEFFSQIPLTCDRLREELHQGEWTENEWNTIRNVSMEHVELEILLVEAEAGMKAWLDDEDDGDDDKSITSLRSNRSLKRSWKGRMQLQSSRLGDNHQVVDNFLSQHVKNVWELGDEIRMRILSGVGSAFDLALQNPAGMVALVEAVEVYERAAEQYRLSRGDDQVEGNDKNSLHFTDMRAAALAQLYQDFELRGLEVFRAIHMQAADIADEEDALVSQFNAVLRAANELVSEIDVVKNQMTPCFAPHWHVEILWSSCVAHVCSNQIIQQIGGPDGQNLPDLSVTQLLDLVAWVEFFRDTIEEAFPAVATVNAKKTYFDERPDLFAGNKKKVNMENAKDSLAWVNNMLWEVHRLAQDEFLLRTRAQTDEWVSKVYSNDHETTQTREGRLVTSLCEDIFSLAGVQLRTIRERLTSKSDALVMTVCLIFTQLQSKQLSSRDKYLKDLESCCAAANDFQRMSEQVEDLVQDIIDNSELPESSIEMLENSCGALVSLYSGDAVYAAQKAHSYIFEPIEAEIADGLFGPAWETEQTHNELAAMITKTLVRIFHPLFISIPSNLIIIIFSFAGRFHGGFGNVLRRIHVEEDCRRAGCGYGCFLHQMSPSQV